jgi:hypothetical protein
MGIELFAVFIPSHSYFIDIVNLQHERNDYERKTQDLSREFRGS